MMLKEQNVIRWLIILIVNVGYSQENLSGVYSPLMDGQEYYKTYEFNNGIFEYHYGSSLGDDEYGTGSYYFEKDSLILNYNTKPADIGYHMSKIWKASSDSIKIQFNVKDYESRSLTGANVIFKDTFNKYNGLETDSIGRAEFQVVKDFIPIEFSISFLTFRTYKFFIIPDQSYEIDVYLARKNSGIPIREKIEKLKVIELSADHLTLKNGEGQILKWRKLR